jgi:hypothetical protein
MRMRQRSLRTDRSPFNEERNMGRKMRLSAPADGSPPKVTPSELLQALGGFRQQACRAFHRLETFAPIKVSDAPSARDLLVVAAPHGR